MKRRTINGIRRHEWGPPVWETTALEPKACSICREPIAIGEKALTRAWVHTYSHKACGEPSKDRITEPSLPPAPCECGDVVGCFECMFRTREASNDL